MELQIRSRKVGLGEGGFDWDCWLLCRWFVFRGVILKTYEGIRASSFESGEQVDLSSYRQEHSHVNPQNDASRRDCYPRAEVV